MSFAMAAGDVTEMRVNTTDGLSQIFNIIHYQLVGISSTLPGPPPVAVDADEFLPAFAEQVYDNISLDWAAVAPDTWKYLGNSAQSIYPEPRSRAYNHFPAAAVEGDIASHSLPAQDTVTILKKSVFGARWGLGRFFYSGIPESMQENGIIGDPYVILLQNLATKLSEGYNVTVGTTSANFAPILFGPGDAPGTVRKTAISDWDVSDNVIKTQRRRRPGKGI